MHELARHLLWARSSRRGDWRPRASRRARESDCLYGCLGSHDTASTPSRERPHSSVQDEQEASVDAMRLGKTCSASGVSGLGMPRLRRVLGFVMALLVLAVAVPAVASAEPLCTDKWEGPAEGEWRTPSDWSTGKVPSSSDVACIGSGKTVKVFESPNQANVVEGKGHLWSRAGWKSQVLLNHQTYTPLRSTAT